MNEETCVKIKRGKKEKKYVDTAPTGVVAVDCKLLFVFRLSINEIKIMRYHWS
jgi:hypothetical protein